MKPDVKEIAGQKSWVIQSDQVRLALTQQGGHMAPVTFLRTSENPVEPYYISPWQTEDVTPDVEVLRPLRGDFFCMPFGGNNRHRGEDHPAHGEPATARWKLADAGQRNGVTYLQASMKTHARPGNVTKTLQLIDGQNVVYVQHRLSGYSGKMSLGHHATLTVPDHSGAMTIATSPFQLGMTNPRLFSDPATGEYQSLAIGKTFKSLSRVPLIWKDPKVGDCSAFPTREGFTDLLAIHRKPGRRPAWTTATVAREGYLWFSLKDPALLPATAMWISNRGRHGSPWNGRNRCLGLEDVCAYFAEGLANSAKKNEISEAGFPTALTLSKRKDTVVNYIEGVVKVPHTFDRVKTVRFAAGKLTFVSPAGRQVEAPVCHEFIDSGKLSAD